MNSRQDFRMILKNKYYTIYHNYLDFKMNPLKLKNLRRNKKNLFDQDIKDISRIKITIDLSKSVRIDQKKNSLKIPYLIKIWRLLILKRKLAAHKEYILNQIINHWLKSKQQNPRDSFKFSWKLKLKYLLFNQ